MGLPFVVVQGPTLVVDVNGNIADVVTTHATPVGNFIQEADGKNRLGVDSLLRGFDGLDWRAVNVETLEGKTRLLTTATVTVEQVFGFDNFADGWFALGDFEDCPTIVQGDAVQINIAQGPCGPTLQPAYSKIVTANAATAADPNPALAFVEQIQNELNLDAAFNEQFRAKIIKDADILHIRSRIQAELGDRPNPGDFTVTVTSGTFGVTMFDQRLIRRGKQNSGARDPRDPRLVTIGISGEVQAVPGAAGDLFIEFATDDGLPTGSNDMTVNGSVTPVPFSIITDDEKDIFISELRFRGQGNGIQMTNFLSQNKSLDFPVEVTIRSDNTQITLPGIFTTSDFKFLFAFGEGQGFDLFDGAGTDDMLAAFTFSFTFPLRKTGSFGLGNDDFIEVLIQDNLSNGISTFQFLGFGFKREV